MESRRSSGQKWTELPKDFVKQVIDALRSSFKDEVKSGKFLFQGRIYPAELLLRMGFLEKGRLRQTNFEVSIDYKPGKDDTYKLLSLGVDVAATMLEDLFSKVDDSDFPRAWQPFEVEGRTLYLQFSAENSELEEEAEKLLGAAEKSLVQGVDEESELSDDEAQLDAIKKRLGVDED